MSMSSQTAENAKLDYEAGQTSYAMAALADSGDQTTFTSAASIWSKKTNYAPEVLPDGMITGGVVSPDNSEVVNKVDITALTCYLVGVLTSVNAGEITAVRGGSADLDHIINSVIITDAGALDVLTGTGHASAHNAVRDTAGGPPPITVGAIEVAQIKFTNHNAAVVAASEIFMVPGTSRDVWDYPLWTENPMISQDSLTPGGSITFQTALQKSHVGTIPKAVYTSCAQPIFTELSPATDYVPPENTHSSSSTQVYNGAIAGQSTSLGGGSFTTFLQSGITDPILGLKDEFLTFRFYPDRYKSAYNLCQGKLGIARTFPPGGNMQAACTISPSQSSVDVGA